jgi:hypothetical protein
MNALAGTAKTGGTTVAQWLGSMANIACILAGVPPILFPVLLFFFAVYDAWEQHKAPTAAAEAAPPRIQSYKESLLRQQSPGPGTTPPS